MINIKCKSGKSNETLSSKNAWSINEKVSRARSF